GPTSTMILPAGTSRSSSLTATVPSGYRFVTRSNVITLTGSPTRPSRENSSTHLNVAAASGSRTGGAGSVTPGTSTYPRRDVFRQRGVLSIYDRRRDDRVVQPAPPASAQAGGAGAHTGRPGHEVPGPGSRPDHHRRGHRADVPGIRPRCPARAEQVLGSA